MRSSRLAVTAASAVAAAVVTALAVFVGTGRTTTVYERGSNVARSLGGGLALHAAPGSRRVLAYIGSRTEFGTPTALAVLAEQGEWLAVISDKIGNGVSGYVHRSQVRLAHDDYALEVDLSAHEVKVWRMGHLMRRIRVAIGGPSSPTPTGEFAVTDKLSRYYPSLYGCCVVALSAHQPHLRPGWRGGDRVAIHEGRGLGSAVSNGCLHARASDMHYLMKRLPLGTQVVIHP
jgi:lipoprotein-anchoring transpeptidase ErfK/SrfK